MSRVIITTSNNLLFDQRVNKISLSLEKAGFEVWRTGRNYANRKSPENRPGRTILLNILFNKGPLFYLFLNVQTFIFLLLNSFDMIWAVDMDTLPAARTAGFLKKKPVVFDGHEFFSEIPEIQHRKIVKKIWIFLEKVFLPGCALHYTVSPGLVSLYKERYNLDFILLKNVPLKRNEEKIPVEKSEHPTILYQGAVNVGRGIKETILAMQYLPDHRFVIVGSGDCFDELKDLTHQLNLEGQVKFTGPVPFEDLYKTINNDVIAGICLHEKLGLNYYYSLPNRLFDYMQAGIPVIANNFPDIAKIVNEQETGLIIENIRPEKIANAIKEATNNLELRKKWQRSIPLAAKKFTWENEEHKIYQIKVIQSVVSS